MATHDSVQNTKAPHFNAVPVSAPASLVVSAGVLISVLPPPPLEMQAPLEYLLFFIFYFFTSIFFDYLRQSRLKPTTQFCQNQNYFFSLVTAAAPQVCIYTKKKKKL
jgi:hypothetical protein